MRWISFLFLLSVSPLLAGEPTDAVLSLLEKLKSENQQPGIPEELAVSSFVGPKTKASLNETWNQRVSWIKSEQVEFFEGYEKIDGDLAAVLIGARSADNPSDVEMMAFAAHLEDRKWRIGPVEGRFANMGLGFGKTLQERMRSLEQWIASERVMAVDRLKKDAMARFKEKMAKVVDPDLLKSATPKQVMENFLAAAKANRVDELLVWQGILEREDHDEIPWDELIYITRQGMKNQDERNVWRVLNRPGVMQVLLSGEEDEREKAMLVSFLAGFKTGRDNKKLRPVIFKVRSTESGWRLSLPAYFAKANEDEWDHWKAHQREVHFRDEVNTERMATVFEKENPALRAKNPKELLDRVAGDLFEGEIERTLQYLYRDAPGEEPEEEEEQEEPAPDEDEDDVPDPDEVLVEEDHVDPEIEKLKRYQEMAVWWTKVSRNEKGIRVGERRVFEAGDLAMGILEILPEEGGWMPGYQTLWMARNEEGWMIIPGNGKPLKGILSSEQDKELLKLSRSASSHREKMENDYLGKLFERVGVVEDGQESVPEEAALDVAKKWRTLVVGGDIPEILSLSGVRKAPEDPKDILENLTYQVKGAAAAKVPDRVLGSHVEGRLRGISMMVDGGRGISMDCPLFVVVQTKVGPRLLIDAELYLGTNKGKEIRNRAQLKVLGEEMKKEDFESLKKLVAWHEKTARPEWDEWNEAVKAQQRD